MRVRFLFFKDEILKRLETLDQENPGIDEGMLLGHVMGSVSV